MPSRASRSFWALSRREARAHAIVLACVSWAVAAVVLFARPGYRDLTGGLKGADFVHFYTLGHLAVTRDVGRLYDAESQHQVQVALVPASASDLYVPVYPPQVALFFAPFALLPYGAAAVLWAVTTTAVYGLAVWAAWRRIRTVVPDVWFVAAAAAGFPPFWSLVLHGQSTTFPLAGFLAGWLLLERGRRYWAGVALGLVAIKPALGVALAVVVVASGEWAVMAGAVTSVALQLAAAGAVLGFQALRAYEETVRRLPQLAPLLEPKPFQLHSVRAVTDLLPSPYGGLAWLIIGTLILVQTIRVWRTSLPLTVRLAVVVVATVLVSPHLTVYDAALLVLPLLWLVPWVEAGPRQTRFFWPTVYWLFVTYLVPTALVVRVQASVFVLAWFFWKVTTVSVVVSREARRSA